MSCTQLLIFRRISTVNKQLQESEEEDDLDARSFQGRGNGGHAKLKGAKGQKRQKGFKGGKGKKAPTQKGQKGHKGDSGPKGSQGSVLDPLLAVLYINDLP